MKKILRLSLALLLTFSLILSSLIFASAAPAVVTDQATFKAAVANGGVINIAEDIKFTEQITISTSVTINAGNHDITMYGNSGGEAFTFTGDGTIVLNGGNWNNPTTADILYFKTFTGTVKLTGGAKFTSSTPINFNISSAEGLLIIDDATIESSGVAINPRGYTEIQILSGTITATGTSAAIKMYNDSKNKSYNKLVIGKPDGTGPVIQNTSSAKESVFEFSGYDTTTTHVFYGGQFLNHGSDYVFDTNKVTSISILGGEFSSDKHHIAWIEGTTNLNVLGGTFNGATSGSSKNIFNISSSGKVVIKGGTFKKGTGAAFNNSNVRISGGTFDFEPSSYVLAGYKANPSNGTYTVAEDASTLPAATTVKDYGELTTAISNKAAYIKLGNKITLEDAITIDFDTVIEGNNSYKIDGNIINVSGASTKITFKDVIYEYSGKALNVSGTPDVTISGGQIFSTITSDTNAAIQVDAFKGVLTVTDDAVIKAYSYPIRTTNNTDSGSGIIYLGDCELVKADPSDGTGGIILHQSNAHFVLDGCTINAAGGHRVFYLDRGHISIKDANITSSASNPIVCLKSSSYNKFFTVTGGTIKGSAANTIKVDELKFYCDIFGGEFSRPAGGRIIEINKDNKYAEITINGGKFTTGDSDAMILNGTNSRFIVNGGTFEATGNSAMFQANKGSLTINGGTFSSANTDPAQDGAVIDTDSGGTCTVNVNNTSVDGVNSIKHTGGIFLRHSTASQVTLNGLDIEQDSTIITIESNAGSITLNNCNLTSGPSAIVSESANPVYVKNYSKISSEDTLAIDGQYEWDETSKVNSETNLHEFAKLVKETLAAGKTELAITKDYTDVPAVVIDKNITLTSDGAHSVTFLGAGLKVQSGATLTIDGDITLNGGSEGNLLEAADGILIVKGGTFASAGAHMVYFNNNSAVVKILGGTFTQNGSGSIMKIGNAAEFTVGDAQTGTGPVMNDNVKGSNILSVDADITNASGVYTINAGSFIKSKAGYAFNFNKAIAPTVNINGGTFEADESAIIIVANSSVQNIAVNGGTYTQKSSGDNAVIYNSAGGGCTVTGGTFNHKGKGHIIETNNNSDNGNIVIGSDNNDNRNAIVVNHSGTGSFLYYNVGYDVTIKNVDIARTGSSSAIINIGSAAAGKVIMNNASLIADYTVVEMPVDCAEVRLELTGGSIIKSNYYKAFVNGVKGTNYTLETEGVDKVIEVSDEELLVPKMLRLTNGYNDIEVTKNFTYSAQLTVGQTYQFDIDFREFGGAGGLDIEACLSTTVAGYDNGANTVEKVAGVTATKTDTHYSIRFTVPDTVKSNTDNFRLRIGQKHNYKDEVRILNYATTLYFANVTLKQEGSNTNLLTNGDFSHSPLGKVTEENASITLNGWKVSDNSFDNFSSVDLMKIPEGFFSGKELADVTDKAIVIEGGARLHELQFHANLKPDTNYELTYYYRAFGDLPTFLMDNSKVTVTPAERGIVTVGNKQYYAQTIKISVGAWDKQSRGYFKWRLPAGAIGAKFYIANVKLYELDANGERTGTNIISDYNPVYDSSVYTEAGLNNAGDRIDLDVGSNNGDTTSDSKAMARYLAHGWLTLFNADKYPDGTDFTQFFGIAKVSANFFEYTASKSAVRNILLNKEEANIVDGDYIDDVYIDGKINVVDLFIAKAESAGKFGADIQAEALKNEILTNTTPVKGTGTTYYVSDTTGNDNYAGTEAKPFKTIKKANQKAQSGDTILLKRGDTWRIEDNSRTGYSTVAGVTYSAYGDGAKPQILGSTQNWVGKWTHVSGNVYYAETYKGSEPSSKYQAGNIYLQKKNGEMVVGTIVKDQAYLTTDTASLTHEGDNYSVEGGSSWSKYVRVYAYFDSEPTSENYASIEIAECRDGVIELSDGVTINNIAVKYAGGHGIAGNNVKDVTVSYCEIGYVGGMLNFDVPMGNGIQFGVAGSNLTADHNYVYQCYDAGITPQSWVLKGDEETEFSGVIFDFTNVKITNNLLTNNFDNIEIWNSNSGVIEAEISGNILKDAADCWSYNQRVYGGNLPMHGCHVYGGRNAYNDKLKLSFTNNIFDNTQSNIFCWFWGGRENAAELPQSYPDSGENYMILSGNSYYQRAGAYDGGQVMYYGNVTDPVHATSQAGLDKAVRMLDNSDSKYVRWVSTNK